jgi:Reverse transcriptase (RNA-dependent DNA polymerase)/Integrase core domain
VDTAATVHTAVPNQNLTNVSNIPTEATAVNGSSILFDREGDISLNSALTLHKVKSGPDIKRNLLSVPRHLRDNSGESVIFFNNTVMFMENGHLVWKFIQENRDEIGIHTTGHRNEDLFIVHNHTKNIPLNVEVHPVAPSTHFVNALVGLSELVKVQRKTWHDRLGHFNRTASLVNSQVDNCEFCIMAKQKRGAFSDASQRVNATKPGEILHFDIAGPIRLPKYDGKDVSLKNNDSILMEIIRKQFGPSKYLGVLVDDFSRKKLTITYDERSDCNQWLKITINQVKIQTGCAVAKLYTDGAGETRSNEFSSWCVSQGITHLQTNKATSQNNGIPERAIQTFFNAVRATLFRAKLPTYFWPAVRHNATFSMNSLRRKIEGNNSLADRSVKSIYERFHNHAIPISLLRVWGCDADVLIPEDDRDDRISPRTIPCVYLGIDPQRENGSIFLDTTKWKILFQRTADCKFHEDKFTYGRSYINNEEGSNIDIEDELLYEDLENKTVSHDNPAASAEQEGNSRIIKNAPTDSLKTPILDYQVVDKRQPIIVQLKGKTRKGRPRIQILQKPRLPKVLKSSPPKRPLSPIKIRERPPNLRERPATRTFSEPLISKLDARMRQMIYSVEMKRESDSEDEPTPLSFREATSLPHAKDWYAATKKEFDTLIDNNTWTLVVPPPGRRIIKHKWVYKIKVDPSTRTKKYKARLTAKGCSQIPGLDFDPNEISSTVIKHKSLRIILAIAVTLGFFIWSLDAVSAFTQSYLDEEIYMEQPEGFVHPSFPSYVCKLIKSLYGLKQASENWHKDVVKALRSLGFKPTLMDDNIFVKVSHYGNYIFICVYVDDFTCAFSPVDEKEFRWIVSKLQDYFDINDLGETKSILGIKINYDRDKGALMLSQENYIENILKEFKMEQCPFIDTPMQKEVDYRGPLSSLHSPLNEDERRYMQDKPYRKLVGMLIYLVNCTRPDLFYVTITLSRFVNDPGPLHWKSGLRVLRYLRLTKHLGLKFVRQPLKNDMFQLSSYTDADWGNNVDDRTSVHGYVALLHGCPISWTSKKQNFVALSSTESEYVGLSETIRENIWIMNLLREIQLPIDKPIIKGDNAASLFVAQAKSMNTKIKSIDIKYHFIKDEVAVKQNFILQKVHTSENIADILTKPLNKEKTYKFTAGILQLSYEQASETR